MIWSFLTLWYLALVVIILHLPSVLLPSGLWRCWLGGRKGIRPVKTERWGAGMVICLECGADLHMAQLMLLPLTVSCFCKIQIGFTFLVPAHLGSPGKRAVKRVCVCVCHNITGVFFCLFNNQHIFLLYVARDLLVLEKPQAYYVSQELFWALHTGMRCWNLMLQMTGMFDMLCCFIVCTLFALQSWLVLTFCIWSIWIVSAKIDDSILICAFWRYAKYCWITWQ